MALEGRLTVRSVAAEVPGELVEEEEEEEEEEEKTTSPLLSCLSRKCVQASMGHSFEAAQRSFFALERDSPTNRHSTSEVQEFVD